MVSSITCAFVLKLLALHYQRAQVCQLEPGRLIQQVQQQGCTPLQPITIAAQLHWPCGLPSSVVGVHLAVALCWGPSRVA